MGFGKHSWDVDFLVLPNMFKTFSGAAILSICASTWSKTSFGLTVIRLTSGWTKKFIWFLIITTNIFMGITGLFNYIRCWPLDKLWDFTGMAPGSCWPGYIILNYNIFSAGMS